MRVITTILILLAIIASDGLGQSGTDRQLPRDTCIDSLSGFPKTSPAREPEPQYPSDLNGLTLEYFASGCFGNCPSFTLTIQKDSAHFEGHSYTRAKGKRTAKVTQRQFEKFLHAWFDGKFFAMRDDYCSIQCPDVAPDIPHTSMTVKVTTYVVTDIPHSSITLKTHTQTKRVYECFATINGKPETPKPPEQYFELSREFLAFTKAQHWL
jgi:hypothetical protein